MRPARDEPANPNAVPARSTVKSADRTIALFECLADAIAAPTFGQIAASTGIPKSSLSQLLTTLVASGYVAFDADRGTYRLSHKIADLSRRALAQVPFEQMLAQEMERLRDQINESVSFHIQRGDSSEVLAAAYNRHGLVVTLLVGDRAPLYALSSGKVILSFFAEEALRAYLKRTKLEKLAPRTIQSKQVLRKQVETARLDRIAYAYEELDTGIRGMAVPVTVGNRLIGAMGVSVPASRYTSQTEASIRVKLVALCNRLSANLGKYQLDDILAVIERMTG